MTILRHPTPLNATVRFKDSHIELAHGAGGKASRRLIEGLITPLLMDGDEATLSDAAHASLPSASVAMTADSFVVSPLRFPGGSIGELAINGTINDLAVSGAQPHSILCTLILEAGLAVDTLQQELKAMRAAADVAGVSIVGGDTKVVEHGKADGMYITTAGLGTPQSHNQLSAARVGVGDKIILSGPIGDHGITILLARGELDLESDLTSDTRSVWPFVAALLEKAGSAVHWMRDPTRGGVATSLTELARDIRLGVHLTESAVPMRPEVRGACEILGLEPLHIANEGQFLAVVAADKAPAALEAVQRVPGGEEAAIVGEIVTEHPGTLQCLTPFGVSRVVDMLVGDPLPRIC